MTFYWLFFSFFAFFSVSTIKLEKNLSFALKSILIFFLIIFIGLRHEVGGDWDIYLYDFYKNIEYFNLLNFNYVRDFGYEFLSYIIYHLDLGIYGLNLILASIFILSLLKFSKNISDNIWLSLTIAFPYLILVVSMGYVRQATALAFILLFLVSFKNNKILSSSIYLLTAVLFHKSAIIIIPIYLVTFLKFNIKAIILFIFTSGFAFVIIFPEIDRIIAGYLFEGSKYVSSGVYYRIALNIFAGLLFIIFYKKIKLNNNLDYFIIIIFLINLLLLLFSFSFSTLVDRLIINFTFIQIIVFSRLYLVNIKYKILINLSVILIYFLLLIIWFNFSNHSYAWLPYDNLLFQLIK